MIRLWATELMDFVGISYRPEIDQLLGQGTAEVTEFSSKDLSFDCLRHLEFLRSVEDGLDEGAYAQTQYWHFLTEHAGYPDITAMEACRRFLRLYNTIREENLDYSWGSIAVTTDGVRLDGAHRAAICYHAGIDRVEVKQYRWLELFDGQVVKSILEEARVRREAQTKYLGRLARDPHTKARVGYVAFVHPRAVKGKWFGRAWETQLGVRSRSGGYVYLPIDAVDMNED